MPSAIILAAGSSTRLGQPKQNIRIANETLLERSVRIADAAGLNPIFVVLPPGLSSPPFDLALEGHTHRLELLINHQASEGMASSIRLGTSAAIKAHAIGAVVIACDQVALTTDHLRALTEVETEVRGSSYAGRNGIPAYFPKSLFEDLLKLTGDTGARDLLRDAVAVPLLNGDLDIDTPADLARARQFYPDIASR